MRGVQGPSVLACAQGRIDALMSDQSAGVDEARSDIFAFEPVIALENGLGAIARGEHSEDMLHGQPMPADDRLPAEDLRVYCDPPEKLILL